MSARSETTSPGECLRNFRSTVFRIVRGDNPGSWSIRTATTGSWPWLEGLFIGGLLWSIGHCKISGFLLAGSRGSGSKDSRIPIHWLSISTEPTLSAASNAIGLILGRFEGLESSLRVTIILVIGLRYGSASWRNRIGIEKTARGLEWLERLARLLLRDLWGIGE